MQCIANVVFLVSPSLGDLGDSVVPRAYSLCASFSRFIRGFTDGVALSLEEKGAQDLQRHIKGGFHKGAFAKHGHAQGSQSSLKGPYLLEGSVQDQLSPTGEASNEQVSFNDEIHKKRGRSRLRGAGKHSGMGVKGRLTLWQQKGVKGQLPQNPDLNVDLLAAQRQSNVAQQGVKGKASFQGSSMLQSSPESKYGGRLLQQTGLKGGLVSNERGVKNLKSATKVFKSSHGTSFQQVSSAKKDVKTNLLAAAAQKGPLEGPGTKGRVATSKDSIRSSVSSVKAQQGPLLAQQANLNEGASPNKFKNNRLVFAPGEERAIKQVQRTGFNNVPQQDASRRPGLASETQQGTKLALGQRLKGRLVPNENLKSSLPLSPNVQLNGGPKKIFVEEKGTNQKHNQQSGIVPSPTGSLNNNLASQQHTKVGSSSVLGVQQGSKPVQQADFKGRVAPSQDLKDNLPSEPQSKLPNGKTVQGVGVSLKLGLNQVDGSRPALTQQTQGTAQSLKGRFATNQNLNTGPLSAVKVQQGLKEVQQVGPNEQVLKSNLLSALSAKQIIEPAQRTALNGKIPKAAFQSKVTSVQERQQVVQSSQQSLHKKLLPNQNPNVGPASALGKQQQVQQAEVKGKTAYKNDLKSNLPLALKSQQVAEPASKTALYENKVVKQSPNDKLGVGEKTQQAAQSFQKASANGISAPANNKGLKLGLVSASGTQEGIQPAQQASLKGRMISTASRTTLLSVQKDQPSQKVVSNAKTIETLHKGQYQGKKSDIQARLATAGGATKELASVQSQNSVQASEHSGRVASSKPELTQQQTGHKTVSSQVGGAEQELNRIAASNLKEQQQQYHHSHLQHQHQLQHQLQQPLVQQQQN